jgi:hypothetical protein
MRVIIAGSRHLTRLDYPLLERAMYNVQKKQGWVITEVVCGEALGGDTLGKRWAKAQGIPWKPFKPDWGDDPDNPNTEAGHIRNEAMAVYTSSELNAKGRKIQGGVVAVWDGFSFGTKDMIARAKVHKLVTYIASTGGRTAKR